VPTSVFNAEVAGTDGKLVGDFNGIPSRAMRYALKQAVRADGRDPDRFIVECEIETAIELMEACDEDS